MALPIQKKRKTQEAIHQSDSSVQEPSSITLPKSSSNSTLRQSTRSQNVTKSSVNSSTNKSIHSFFNTRTSLQTQSPPTLRTRTVNSSSNIGTSLDLDEDRIEEVEDTGKVAAKMISKLHGDSNTVFGQRSALSSGRGLIPTKGPFGSEQGHRLNEKTSSDVPWTDAFPPLSLEELAVNKKKIESINTWMKEALSGHRYRRILVLRGPAGCGKSSTVRILAQARHASLAEWSNPLQAVFGDENYTSISAQFSDFMNRGGQFSTLNFGDKQVKEKISQQDSSSRSEILLVDEFPFTSQAGNTNARLRESLMLHLEADRASPLILIFSEDEAIQSEPVGQVTAYQLLGSDLLTHPATAVIDCNKIAATYMVKALELVIKKEARQSRRARPVSMSILRTLANSGDIRSAIYLLQFLCTEDHRTQEDLLPRKRSLAGFKKSPYLMNHAY